MNKNDMIALAREAAQREGIRPEVLIGLLQQESGFDPNAKSSAGATGVAQFMPDTAKRFGINSRDPAQAIPAAAKYLSQLMRQFGSERSALQAYNWGEGNLASWLKTGVGVKGQPMPKETMDYAPAVLAHARKFITTDEAPMLLASKDTTPAMSINTRGAQPRIAVPGTSQEADYMRRIAEKNYPEHVQQGMVNVLSQLLPARDMLAGRDLFADASLDGLPTDLPDDYDELISEIIDKA